MSNQDGLTERRNDEMEVRITVAQFAVDSHRIEDYHYALCVYAPTTSNRATMWKTRCANAALHQYTPPEVTQHYTHQDSSFRGEFAVGQFRATTQEMYRFENIIRNVPVICGEKRWNAQDWVADCLQTLVEQNITVAGFSRRQLNEIMATVRK